MQFTKEAIESAITAMGNDSSRYNIKCLRVESDCIVATDGHRMIRIKTADESSDAEPVHIGAADAKKIAKKMDRGATATVESSRLGMDERVWSVRSSCGFSMEFKPADVEYPDYKQIWPSESDRTVIGLNAKYLMELCKAAIKSGISSRSLAITLSFSDSMSPVEIKGSNVEDGTEFRSVLMPMRT